MKKFFTISAIALSLGAQTLFAQTLAHRYSFNSDTTDSVGGANLTISANNASVLQGKLVLNGAKGAGADATGDKADAGTSLGKLAATLNAGTPITIEAWYTINAKTQWSKMFFAGAAGNAGKNDFILFNASVNDTGIGGPEVPGAKTNDNTATPLKKQVYVVATFDQTANTVTYKRSFNGTDILTFNGSMNGQTLTELDVGKFSIGATNPWNNFSINGTVDEFRV